MNHIESAINLKIEKCRKCVKSKIAVVRQETNKGDDYYYSVMCFKCNMFATGRTPTKAVENWNHYQTFYHVFNKNQEYLDGLPLEMAERYYCNTTNAENSIKRYKEDGNLNHLHDALKYLVSEAKRVCQL